MDIEHYHLISELDVKSLNEEVEKLLHAGWQPWQSPTLAHSGTQRFYIQAMVKYAKKPQHLTTPR